MGNCGGKETEEDVFVAKDAYTPLAWPPSASDRVDHKGARLDLLAIQIGDELVPKSDKEHDPMQVLVVDSFGETFHYMKNRRTKEKGYVSSHYIAAKGSMDQHRWHFGHIGREHAVSFLQKQWNINGSWLIRESVTKEDHYVLTIKVYDEAERFYDYKHYLIKVTDTHCYCTHNPRQKFNNLPALADAASNGKLQKMPVKLTNICQRPRPSTFNEIGAVTGTFLIAREDVRFSPEDKIGSGHFGEVFKGTFLGTLVVAVKTLKSDSETDDKAKLDKARREFLDEANILQQLHHPHLVQVFGICTDSSPFVIVTEFLPKGDLRNFLLNAEEGEITFEQLVTFCENIASGMQALELKGIVHCDLAARNVMVDQSGQAKVGDFGLARQNCASTQVARDSIPWKWTAPEAISSAVFTHKSDVWSYGVVLWEIFTFGATPYSGKKNRDLLVLLQSGYRLPMPGYQRTNIDGVYTIMLNCWNEEEVSRPSFGALYNDFHFQDFDAAIEERYVRKRSKKKKTGSKSKNRSDN